MSNSPLKNHAIKVFEEFILKSPEFKDFFTRLKVNNPCVSLLDYYLFVGEINNFTEIPYYNDVLDKIQRASIKTINEILFEDLINNKNEDEFKELINVNFFEYCQTQYLIILNSISKRYHLTEINKSILNNISILKDDEILFISPLLFSRTTWKRVILHELKLIENIEFLDLSISKIKNNFEALNLKLASHELPVLEMDEGIKKYKKPKEIPYYNFDFIYNTGLEWLNTIDIEELKLEFTKDIKLEIRKLNLKVKSLKEKNIPLSFFVKKKKHHQNILSGLKYLIETNTNLNKEEALNVSKYILEQLFFKLDDKTLIPKEILNTIKINKVIIEFFIFLESQNKFIDKTNKSIVKIISSNLSSQLKGFSYKNLIKIYNQVTLDGILTFETIPNTKVLGSKMRK